MSDVVTLSREGAIGLIALNNPPVNAASQAIRAGLVEGIDQHNADPKVEVIAIYGEGRTFVAGADIREFGKPPLSPSLPEVCNHIEASAKPVICVLHGTTLGGGFEIALASHVRVGIEGVRVGLPEINLGIFPGAGGTQRAPRLMGFDAALELMTSGRQISGADALAKGALDMMTGVTPREAALAAGAALLSGQLESRRTGGQDLAADPELLDQWRAKMRAKSPQLMAPQHLIDATEGASGPLAEGLSNERRLFVECLESPQSKALIHAFFAERAVQKIPEARAEPRDISHVGVIGGGTMGAGIGTAMLLAGLRLTLSERDEASAERARATISGNLDGAVKRGKLAAERRDAILADQFKTSVGLDGLATCDLVIEAVFEDMEVKRAVFGDLDKICKPGAILATNTSYLNVNEIAAATSRPQDVIGLHFFSPAHIMRLVEVVVADKTAPELVATGFALARKLGKVAVRAGVCNGFIGNRIMAHYLKSTGYMVMDGASPEQLDSALESFGFAMGPLAVGDLAGLDIGWSNRKRQAPNRDPAERYIAIADRICEAGWFGRKTGQGWYVYDGKNRSPNPEVAAIIDAQRTAAGVTPRPFSDQEIVDRYMTAMICEATRVLEDGIAARPVDIDAVMLFGYGFPRFHGGPLFYADTIGAKELVARITRYAQEDSYYWQVPALLNTMAEQGTSFADLNKA